jgi:hypothetical protein
VIIDGDILKITPDAFLNADFKIIEPPTGQVWDANFSNFNLKNKKLDLALTHRVYRDTKMLLMHYKMALNKSVD